MALPAGCQMQPQAVPVGTRDQGEAHIYMQPLPQEAQRLRFRLQSVAAVKNDGTPVPLPLTFTGFSAKELQRQRLLAVGALAPGEYKGLSFVVASAHLVTEEGEIALAVSAEPHLVAFPFQIRKDSAQLLLLTFNYDKALGPESVQFSPAFSIYLPGKLTPKVLGYVANEKSDTITVFDKNMLQVVGVIAARSGPKDVALDRNQHRAYVPLAGEDTLALIDLNALTIIDRARLNISDAPCETVLSPDGRLLVTTNSASDTVTLTDPATLMERARIPVGDGPCAVLVDGRSRKAYVLNIWSGTISVIDLANQLVAATLSVGPKPVAAAFSPDGGQLFVAHASAPHMEIIDTRTLTVVHRFFVGTGISDVIMDSRTAMLYIARHHEGAVEILDPSSLFAVDRIRLGEAVGDLAIDEEEGNLFVTLPESRQVAVYDLVSRKRVALMDVGGGPCGLTLTGDR